MPKSIAPFCVSIAVLSALSVTGCTTLGQKPQAPGSTAPSQAQTVPMDADIQRILSAGGIDPMEPAIAALTTPDPVPVPAASTQSAQPLGKLPPPPPAAPVPAPAEPAPHASLGLDQNPQVLPSNVAVGGGSYDYMGNFNLPASVSAGILPSPDLAGGQVIDITGPNAQDMPKPDRKPQTSVVAPIPAQRPASLTASAGVSPISAAPAASSYQAPTSNVDKPLAPVKRF